MISLIEKMKCPITIPINAQIRRCADLRVVIFIFLFLLSCNRHPYAGSNKKYKKQVKEYTDLLKQYPLKDSVSNSPYWVGTTNFSLRRPNYVIIHHTAQNSCDQTLKTFTLERTQVSSHYVICKDGTVYHMLNDYYRAWHGGVSKWGNTTDLNSSSIGIELDNNGFEPFPEAQMNSLGELLGRLKRSFFIPTPNFIGHADIAPGRKVDPNRYFPWEKFAKEGYGIWWDTTGITVPVDFNPLQALRIIGYDTKTPEYAIQSYKIHFVQHDTTLKLNEYDNKILYDLMKKSQ
jgi:N-acetylmuramoyl-L-alanine amidase